MARAGRRTAVLALLALLCFARPVAGGRKPRPAGLKPRASAVTGPAFVEVNGTLVATAPPKPKKPFTGTWLTRHYLNTSYYDEAVCNDQSAPVFYFSEASTPHGQSQWLIWLQGGGWCWSSESCVSRGSSVPGMTTTMDAPLQVHLGGVFDHDVKRNPFAGVNKVYIQYCSSDAWAGDTDNLVGEVWWRFRGQRILSAVIHTLITDFGMDTAKGVVLGGCHEGARGAMYNSQNVQNMLPSTVDLRVVVDSGFELDVVPYDGAANPLVLTDDVQNQTASAYQFLNGTGVVGDTPCGATYDLSTPWKCLFPPYRMPLMGGTPRYMSIMSQFDAWQLPQAAGVPPPYTANDTELFAYVNAFQRGVRSFALQLPTSGQGGSAIYSSACYSTCTTLSGSFWSIRVNNITAADYLAAWWGGSGQPVNQVLANAAQVIESCSGFGCGQCASLTFAPAPPLPPARKGLQAPPLSGSGYPPAGWLATKMGIIPGETPQQRQKAREQAREARRADSSLSAGTLRLIHTAALLCVLLLCIIARPVFKAANKASSSSGRTGSAELTPLVPPGSAAQQFYKPVRAPPIASVKRGAAGPPAAKV